MSLRETFKRITKRLNARREERRRHKERAERKLVRVGVARREIQARLKAIDRARDRGDHARIEVLKAEVVRLRRIKGVRRDAAEHSRDRIAELTSRISWYVQRQTILRRKLREAKARRDPKPEPWHGNGHEWRNLTDRARKLLAYAVVKFDLYCTSITRDWGTGSFHEDVPTRGFDVAGPRMTAFQRACFNGEIPGFDRADFLELFGPDNNACLDDGRPAPQAEGSPNEQLHDSHDHCFTY